MSDTTPNLRLPYILPAQAQKHVTHNEAIRALDALVQLSVISRSLTAPPVSPLEGARYIVAGSASGAWAGAGGKIAAFQDGAWTLYAPAIGWTAWVQAEVLLCAYDGSHWVAAVDNAVSVNPAPLVGVNATADSTNRLSVSSAASLFSHAGNDHRQKINKAASANTASQLFQTAFSGRAEMGLAGDDNFHLKVSADGSVWKEAMVVDRSTGAVSFPFSTFGNASPWSGRKWAALGTSITSQGYYTTPLAGLLDATLVNLGVSGGHLSVPQAGGGLEIYNQVASIPADADLATLEAGINDFIRASTLGTLADTTTATFYGALRKTGTEILAANPARVLVFLTPYSNEAGGSPDWDTPNANANTLYQFQQAVRDVARNLGCPVIDAGAESGISAQSAALYLSDGLHLNSAGGQRYAQFAYDRLLTIRPPLPQVATPALSPTGGAYTSSQTVTLACATAGAAIHYTTDGSSPNASSPTYATPLAVASTTTLKALAVKSGMRDSAIASATYTIGTAFSPANLSPAAWWDASDLATLWKDVGGTTPVTADSDAVARIDDKSGNGRHLTQASSGARPPYKTDGALRWLAMDSGKTLSLSARYGTPAGSFAVAWASRKNDTSAGNSVVTGTYGGVYNCWAGDNVLGGGQPNFQISDANGTNAQSVNGGFAASTITSDHVNILNVNAGAVTHYQNGVAGGTGTINTAYVFNTWGMAFELSAYQYAGRIYELILVPRALTSQEIASLTTWLKGKAGVA